ncbi:MAG: hypothetical protein AB202_03025 [Parcubacteria bacterium C7867-007]|nr:MAG: hypothetical protein AB202_03025 [Parcubacteria bacterium C7867-007]
MALSARSIRIIAASALSLVLVVGAYAASGPLNFLKGRIVGAQSTESLLKAYAAKDSDGDALPDWQEALYGTNPNDPHSFDAVLTDSEAVNKGLVTPKTSAVIPADPSTNTPDTAADVPGKDPAPGSLTDEFGRQFFQQYVAAGNGGQLTEEQKEALIAKLLADFSLRASKLLVSPYTAVSIRVSPSADVVTYLDSVEKVIRENDVPAGAGEPAPLMQAFLEESDLEAGKKIVALGGAYGSISENLLAIQPPPAYGAQHLALVQSFDTLSRSMKAVSKYETDPLAVLGSLSLLQPTSQVIVNTFKQMAVTTISQIGEPVSGTPGALIVNIARSTEQTP